MQRRFKFSFEVNEERAKTIMPLLVDYVGRFICAEVVSDEIVPPVKMNSRSTGRVSPQEHEANRRHRADYYRTGDGKELAKAVVEFLEAKKTPTHYTELSELMVARSRKPSSLNAILSDMRAAGLVIRDRPGYFTVRA